VALTANAVSGMKELFLKNGFNDFISKPIDASRLDAVLRTWILSRKEGQGAPVDAESAREDNALTELPLPDIEGIDAIAGLARFGGVTKAYLMTLEVFRDDARDGMKALRFALNVQDCRQFTIRVHGLKSALGTIGAAGLAEQAAALETAGQAEDVDFIRRNIETFLRELNRIQESLTDFLQTNRAKKPGQ
jgi:HPt (histidine-containing phosphotransfer) domain-containing protein